jgi:hypothetical protein
MEIIKRIVLIDLDPKSDSFTNKQV